MKYFEIEELKALVRAIPAERQRLGVLLAFNHGLRVSELLALDKSALRNGYVQVQRLKGSDKTTQAWQRNPAHPELDEYVLLEKIVPTMMRDEKLLNMTRDGFRKLIQRAGARAGISAGAKYNTKLTPHALKHTCAMQSIGQGIHITRRLLGHKSLSSTGEYLKVSDEQVTEAMNNRWGVV